MDKDNIIMISGAAGFIGSRLAAFLNEKGYDRLILVDAFDREDKQPNLSDLKFLAKVERDGLFQWLGDPANRADFVFHLGARTDTTEFDYEIHRRLNLEYSRQVWDYCSRRQVPLVYASSAATYGGGELGYKDDHDIIDQLKPLNPYGLSKNEFDKWVLQQQVHPPFWAGLKFFNVYGPNEYHKGRMASVIWHAYNQIKDSGEVKLFRSHRPGIKDGEQLRDFIYVRDILKVCYWLMQTSPPSAIYNLGTGKARSFADLARAVFAALGKESNIQFIDMPLDIREKYQYFTEANMDKLRAAGYDEAFYSLEAGVKEYVQEFLVNRR
ncbi:MAG TPA: ADP-glyceromanno-heptose 6-epimerase [Flavitalea sp.]|nr:ADP-glyceromanno-heptose 6-epimerase [Flavitalea sp.]